MVSVSSIGSVVGSLLGGCECLACQSIEIVTLFLKGLADYISRKYALFFSGVVMMLGSIILSSTSRLW